jgi:hypothetical protein
MDAVVVAGRREQVGAFFASASLWMQTACYSLAVKREMERGVSSA